jgi:hypothetical protein
MGPAESPVCQTISPLTSEARCGPWLAAALHGAGCDYMVFGGVAIIARGVPRHTDDVDATVWAESRQLAPLLEHLSACEIRPRIDDAAAFARENRVLLLRHQPSDIAIDLTFAWLPFEKEALGRAEVMDLGGVRVPVATPEDLVIYKAVAWRDRDRADIERLMAIWGTRMYHVQEGAIFLELGVEGAPAASSHGRRQPPPKYIRRRLRARLPHHFAATTKEGTRLSTSRCESSV